MGSSVSRASADVKREVGEAPNSQEAGVLDSLLQRFDYRGLSADKPSTTVVRSSSIPIWP
jgi:hypothetical protein